MRPERKKEIEAIEAARQQKARSRKKRIDAAGALKRNQSDSDRKTVKHGQHKTDKRSRKFTAIFCGIEAAG